MITAEQLKDLQDRTEALYRYLDIERKQVEVEEEELRTQAPGFWDDPKAAEEQMKVVKGLRKWIDNYHELKTLVDVGLGYIALGQSATTLSGGEAQRIKLATELSKRSTGKTLYLLDEPTTGLHFDDVAKLMKILLQLRDQGNTIVVIEHNLDVIRSADWIIDLGPGGGDKGGNLVCEGPVPKIRACKDSVTGRFL